MSDSSFYPKVVKIVKIPGMSQEYLSQISGILNMKFVFNIHVVFNNTLNEFGTIVSYYFLELTFHFTLHLEGTKQCRTLQDLNISRERTYSLCSIADDSACEWFGTLTFCASTCFEVINFSLKSPLDKIRKGAKLNEQLILFQKSE